MKIILLGIGCVLALSLVLAVKPQKKNVEVPITPPPSPTPEENIIRLLPNGKIPQMVVLSFDGSRSLQMWKETLDFAKEEANKGIPIRYTYFISGVYLLPYQARMEYQAPGQKPGESKIGFADNPADVEERTKLINQAIADGHEIGSHLNGHFPGGGWSGSQWESEFNNFEILVFKSKYSKLNLAKADVIGFRAPNLAENNNLWPVLTKYGYKYDAGSSGKSDEWPKMENGVWKIVLPAIAISGTTKGALAMDYNFYVTQTGAVDTLKRDTPLWIATKQQVTKSLKDYLQRNLNGNRAPVVFSSHFSEWNQGVYWEAVKEFAREACANEEVRCVSYKDVVKFMEEKSVN